MGCFLFLLGVEQVLYQMKQKMFLAAVIETATT